MAVRDWSARQVRAFWLAAAALELVFVWRIRDITRRQAEDGESRRALPAHVVGSARADGPLPDSGGPSTTPTGAAALEHREGELREAARLMLLAWAVLVATLGVTWVWARDHRGGTAW
jgi:hypothetical protein